MQWLESTALAEWVRTSLVGYPFVLTVHSIGMAIMVGLVWVIDIRLLGWFKRVPYTALHRLLRVAWYGLAVNALSGAAIFTSQATFYVSSPPFLIKMLMIVCGSIVAAYMHPILRREGPSWDAGAAVPQRLKVLAAGSAAMWLIAIITGRFTAYL